LSDWNTKLDRANGEIAELQVRISFQREAVKRLAEAGADTTLAQRILDIRRERLVRALDHRQFIASQIGDRGEGESARRTASDPLSDPLRFRWDRRRAISLIGAPVPAPFCDARGVAIIPVCDHPGLRSIRFAVAWLYRPNSWNDGHGRVKVVPGAAVGLAACLASLARAGPASGPGFGRARDPQKLSTASATASVVSA
jgi:hypothetical protein